MKGFREKVAVVTGAASGIGRALAEHAARAGMRVVLADVNEVDLARVAEDLQAGGAQALAVRTDVSKPADVEALARRALEVFGAVHLLCNNAGVIAGSTIWDSTPEDYEWVLGINVWGVIHGLRVFVPIMLRQDTECHIVNTASATALLSNNPVAPYNMSKHAVLGLSETLYYSLRQRSAKVGASVLCPGWVRTHIMDSARNRPAPPASLAGRRFSRAVESPMLPAQVAEIVFKAIEDEQFYIVTHPEVLPWVQQRAQDIVDGRSPE